MKLFRHILNKCFSLPIPIRIYSLIDLFSSTAQGLGWGAGTIKQEINACLSLLRTKPKIFIDIGASVGTFTLLAAIKKECKVISILNPTHS